MSESSTNIYYYKDPLFHSWIHKIPGDDLVAFSIEIDKSSVSFFIHKLDIPEFIKTLDMLKVAAEKEIK